MATLIDYPSLPDGKPNSESAESETNFFEIFFEIFFDAALSLLGRGVRIKFGRDDHDPGPNDA